MSLLRSFLAPVCWQSRLSSLSFIDCQRRANLGRPIRSLYWRCGCLAERQQVTFLNPSKTQVLWLGSRYLVDRITVRYVPVLFSSVQVVDSACECDLGVVIDSHLTMADHVTTVCRATYFHLRQLCLITRSLSVDAAMTLVQSFISCHLDYCNSLFSVITDSLLGRLQSVQIRRPELCSCWTAALEQSAGLDLPARQYHWRILSAAKVVFV